MRTKRTVFAFAVFAAFAFSSMGSAQTQNPDVAMQAAIRTETVDGDLRKAIAQYEVLAKGSDRVTAAKALLRMAECYQKLGDAQARTTYERLVREFGDQKDAVAVARSQLGGGGIVARSKSERPIALDPSLTFVGTVSGDGRFLSHVERATGNVMLRDLTTGTDRVLVLATKTRTESPRGYSATSRDGKQVAFYQYVYDSEAGRTAGMRPTGVELRIASSEAPAVSETRRLLALGSDVADEVAPFDWSPDGKWLAVRVVRPGPGSQIALVSVRDGAMRVLKSIEWGATRSIFFSPDGRYIAYSLPKAGTHNESHVFVMTVDGSRESTVVEHPSQNQIMGWSPDGATLLFASDRNGALRLWTLPVSEGRSHGTPALVDSDIIVGSVPVSLGVTASGALFVGKFTQNMHVQVSPIDLTAGRLLADSAASPRVFVGFGGKPTWSADGKYLAYQSCPANCDRTGQIKIRAMDTDQVRELPMRLRYLMARTDLAWSADGRSLLVDAVDLKGRRGNYLIDVQTGEASPDSSGADPNDMTNVTLDGTKIYAGVGGSIVERDRPSGKERLLFAERANGNSVLVNSSPDRRYSAFIETTSNRVSTLFVMPYGGGEPRELLRATALDRFDRNGMTWTPDSRGILLMKADGDRKELWLIPVADGSAPRKLDIDVDNWHVNNISGFKLKPDGRQVAFVAGESKNEVWALENFLPKTKVGSR